MYPADIKPLSPLSLSFFFLDDGADSDQALTSASAVERRTLIIRCVIIIHILYSPAIRNGYNSYGLIYNLFYWAAISLHYHGRVGAKI